jgi:hypothetical protein
MSTETVITDQRYSQGFTCQAYLDQLGDTRQRFTPHETDFRLAPDDAKFFQDTVQRLGPIRVVAVVEDWCPDVHRGLPVMAAIAEASGMDLRVFPRDENIDIMNLYLNQGEFLSIPVFAFFRQNLNPLFHWIERPRAANQFIEELADELSREGLPEEELWAERRKRNHSMADTWRQETVKELKDLFAGM